MWLAHSQPRVYRVDIHRVWRNSGFFPLKNFFVIGRTKDSFTMRIMPLAFLGEYLPATVNEFEAHGVTKWAQGELSPAKAIFHELPYYEPDIRDLLRFAFLRRRADQHLDEFLPAELYVGNLPLNCTIESLLVPLGTVH